MEPLHKCFNTSILKRKSKPLKDGRLSRETEDRTLVGTGVEVLCRITSISLRDEPSLYKHMSNLLNDMGDEYLILIMTVMTVYWRGRTH